MPESRKAEIRKQTRVFDGFFKIDEVLVVHQRLDGKMSGEERRLIFERGDSVAIVLYNSDRHEVVLVNQFKVPSLVARRRDDPLTTDGWVTELPAGMIDGDETPEQAIIRETMEETGYQIREPRPICKFFSSPGGTSERIFLFYAEVDDAARTGKGGGIDDEDVAVSTLHANALFDRLKNGRIEDPKLAIGAAWLQEHLRHTRPLASDERLYQIKDRSGCFVGFKTGAIDHVDGVSAWVNSENTDMMMDRFIGKTISAKIRYLGANKDDENVVEDTIQESLRDAIGERAYVKIGTVLVTGAGMLASRGVERIFHVATVKGGPGEGVSAEPDKLELCIRRVLEKVDQENRKFWRILSGKKIDSILFPLLGAGDGGLPVEAVTDIIIPTAVEYVRSNPTSSLRKVFFLAFRPRDKSACVRTLDRLRAEKRLD